MIPNRMIKTAPLQRVQKTQRETQRETQDQTLDDIDDCTLMYDSFFDDRLLDVLRKFNDCTDPGGHVYLAEHGDCRCMHCGAKP